MAREALEIGGKLSCRVRGGSPLRTAALGPPGGRIQTRPENTVITSSDSGYQLPAPAVSLGAPMRQGGVVPECTSRAALQLVSTAATETPSG